MEEKPGGDRWTRVGACERLVGPIGGRGTAGTGVDNLEPIVGRSVDRVGRSVDRAEVGI